MIKLMVLIGVITLAHFADRPDLNNWAAKLQSPGGGMCCSFADAEALTDVQWDTKDGHYRVFLDERWIDVRDSAVVSAANRYGPAVVWPIRYNDKVIDIRCFMPGAGT
jgi:hypothetical protein